MVDDSEDLDSVLERLFGKPIFSYTDDQAVADGILIPFLTARSDTGHRITRTAFDTLEHHHRDHGYSSYTKEQFYRFFFAELLPLVPEARRQYAHGSILKTTYDFRVVQEDSDVLWYLPNEKHGITVMLPSDY